MQSTYESEVRIIPFPQEKVYAKIADLNHLESVREHLPEEKVKELTFDTDSVSFTLSPLGHVTFDIIEREPYKCVKLASSNLPISFNLWVQIVPLDNAQCKMRLSVRTDINPFLKGMIEKPLKETLERMVIILSELNYD